MKPSTLAIVIVIAIVFFAVIAGGIDLSQMGSKAGLVYTGRIAVNFVQLKRVDGSVYGIADGQMRVIHSSKSFNDKVGTVTSSAIEGDMKESDKGTWFLILDYTTNQTLWLDAEETGKSAYVKSITGWDGDVDGFNEECVELYFGDLGSLKAGESKKTIEVNLVSSPARRSSITLTSLTNASAAMSTAYAYYTATGYMGGFSEGDLGYLAKIQLDFSASGNTTYPDTEAWKLTSFKLGAWSFTATEFGTYDLANTRYELKFGDQVNRQGGKSYYYAKNAGDLWSSFELKAYCKYSTNRVQPTIKLYFYQPDGTITAAFTHNVDFQSTG